MLSALNEITWMRQGGIANEQACAEEGQREREVLIVNETKAIRTEVLEIEVENLTKEVVEARASRAATVHRVRMFIEDLALTARELGDAHAMLCIGLEDVVMDSEENTYSVLQQHKHVLQELADEKEARRLAEDALVALEKRKKWSRAGQITNDEIMHHAYVLKLRHDLSDVQRKMRTLTEEAQVTRLPPSVS